MMFQSLHVSLSNGTEYDATLVVEHDGPEFALYKMNPGTSCGIRVTKLFDRECDAIAWAVNTYGKRPIRMARYLRSVA